MKIATGILTATRPGPSTLQQTADSLVVAGFPVDRIYNDVCYAGQYPAWIDLLKSLVEGVSVADAFFLVEDDMIFWRGLREYIESLVFEPHAAIYSPFRPGIYPPGKHGWNPISASDGLGSGNSWLLPRAIALRILVAAAEIGQLGPWNHADQRVGLWIAQEWLVAYFHTPSLAQHLWGKTRLDHNGECRAENYLASDFVGELGEVHL
jgi:hypothetical protein